MKHDGTEQVRLTLLQLGSATKAEISGRTGISFPTVGKVLERMERAGELRPAVLDQSSGGRRALRYTLDPEYRLGMAAYLEADRTICTVFNLAGETKEHFRFPGVLRVGPDQLVEQLASVKARYPNTAALAVGVPGSVNGGTIFYIPGYAAYAGLYLKGFCERKLGLETVVENDMNAAALGYLDSGNAGDDRTVVYLYIGPNGPGAGIVAGGSVLRGSTLFAGEIGFLPLSGGENFHDRVGEAAGADDTPPRLTGSEPKIAAAGRLVAVLASILNPHDVVFSKENADAVTLQAIREHAARIVPEKHLPALSVRVMEEDYLGGLRRLALERMLAGGDRPVHFYEE